jgi:hypothetical protein
MTVTPGYAAPGEGELSVGHVFSSAWAVLTANFGKLFAIGLLVALPNLLAGLALPTDPTAPGAAPAMAGWFFIVWLLVMVLNLVSQAAVLVIAFQYLRGHPASIGEALGKGLERFFPILGLVILFTLGLSVGLILLVIPGIILAVVWSVSVPACVLEGTGPVASLRRSAALTKGHRWKIFGIYVLIWIASAIVIGLLGLVSRQFGWMADLLVSFLWTGFITAYFNSVLVMIYHDLRVAKEGIDVHQIAAVFD